MLTSFEIENFEGIAVRQGIDFALLALLFGASACKQRLGLFVRKGLADGNAAGEPVAPPVTPPVGDPVERLLVALAGGDLDGAGLRARLKLRDKTHLRERYINPALANALIERTIPDKPNSRLQRYRLTEAGKANLAAKPGGRR